MEQIAKDNGFADFISGNMEGKSAAEMAVVAMKACIGAIWHDSGETVIEIFKACERLGFYERSESD